MSAKSAALQSRLARRLAAQLTPAEALEYAQYCDGNPTGRHALKAKAILERPSRDISLEEARICDQPGRWIMFDLLYQEASPKSLAMLVEQESARAGRIQKVRKIAVRASTAEKPSLEDLRRRHSDLLTGSGLAARVFPLIFHEHDAPAGGWSASNIALRLAGASKRPSGSTRARIRTALDRLVAARLIERVGTVWQLSEVVRRPR